MTRAHISRNSFQQGLVPQFEKIEPGLSINYTPFEYGSVMHYAANLWVPMFKNVHLLALTQIIIAIQTGPQYRNDEGDLFRFTPKGISLVPIKGRYLYTLGTRVISFYDIKMLNEHYKCSGTLKTGTLSCWISSQWFEARCAAEAAACINGGYPNPQDCSACLCPAGYSGRLCGQRVRFW